MRSVDDGRSGLWYNGGMMSEPKILYLHGFASSGASGTVDLLRREFWTNSAPENRLKIVAPDIPVDPQEALPMLKALVAKEDPILIIGTSMGAMYAQQLRGVTRVCINPSFGISKLYSLLHVGKYKWLSKRADGATEFHVYKETIERFAEMEAHQFDGITDEDRALCFGLFGDADTIAPGNRPIFETHYPGQSRVFSGGHRLNDDAVKNVLLPFIRELGI